MNIKIGGGNSYQQSKFKTGKRTCPICGNTHRWHCSETEDGGLVYCKHVPSEKTDSQGRYEHIMKKGQSQFTTSQMVSEQTESKSIKADVDRLNEVYTAFLESLELNEHHADNLLYERGLSDTKIAQNLYASVPAYKDRFEIAGKLAESFDLEGIPGFYFEDGRWALHLTFDGFYVPYRDERGRIVGLQILGFQ